MSHYFTNDDVKSNEKLIDIKINGNSYSFYVDSGTFSKKGLDFGTRTLLESIDLSEINGDILDFGCGWGPIGIYIAKETESYVDMIDVNRKALALSCKNARLNDVSVNVFESNMYENVDKKYDFIISNPPIRVGKKILYEILFMAYDFLKENGKLLIVVNKDQGAKSLMKDLSQRYDVEVVRKNKGFYVIKASK
ncbi:MAG: class I SAM-dependent methyltransferase [Bacilli bacterium]|nr:class I SAM-dependent methyltransferase [Bacilli bacterium]